MYKSVCLLLAVLLACAAAGVAPGKHFDRIFVIQFENQAYVPVNSNPIFNAFGKQGVLLDNYFAVTHPSQPNYISQVAGDFFGISDDNYHTLNSSITHLGDLLEAKGFTWKAYEEDYPENCFDGVMQGKYFRKHNPFIAFENVRQDPKRCANMVNAQNHLEDDIANGNLANFNYYTPNILNDGHNTTLEYAAKWVNGFLPPLLKNPLFNDGRTVVVLTWDEDDYTEANHIQTVLLGKAVRTGVVDDTKYTHYSLLRTVEDNFALGTLGRNDDAATPYDVTNYNTGVY